MHWIATPQQAAKVLGVHELTVRKWINDGKIRHAFTNGYTGKAVRHYIDMTAQYGLKKEEDDE